MRRYSGKKRIDINQKSFAFTHRYDEDKFYSEKKLTKTRIFLTKINNRLILSSLFFTAIFCVVAIKIIEVNLFNNDKPSIFNKSYTDERGNILDRNKNVHIVITNSIVEHYLNTMMTWNYDGWQFINGQKYVTEYLYSIAHPSFSSVVFDRNFLQLLGYNETYILPTEYRTKKIHFDEALIFIILLCLNGDVAINGKVYTFRGSPPDSYRRSNDWGLFGGSIGGMIPLLNFYFKETKENNRKIILNVILKVYATLKFQHLRFLPFLLKKYGTLYVLFYAQMLNEGDPYKDNAPTILNNYINHSSTQEIKKETETQFKDFNPYKESIEKYLH